MSLAFFLAWGVLTTILVFTVTLPCAAAATACLVRGPGAYFQQGVTGELVPGLPSAIVTLLACFPTLWLVGVSLNASVQTLRRIGGRRNGC